MAGETQPVSAAFARPPTMAWMPGANPGMTNTDVFLDLRRPRPFHRELRLEACDVAIDGGNGAHAAVALVLQQAILAGDVAVDNDFVPLLGVADIIDRHIVMLAPEERYGMERLALTEHVARGGLAL